MSGARTQRSPSGRAEIESGAASGPSSKRGSGARSDRVMVWGMGHPPDIQAVIAGLRKGQFIQGER